MSMDSSHSTESKPELTIICPTYNNSIGANNLVNDFYRLHDPDTFRIISIDQTQDGIRFDKTVHLHIRSYRNLGFSKAMNTGWKLSQTKYTLLANDDVRLLSKRWYDDAKAHLEQSKDVLAVNPFPALRTWNGSGEPTWYWDVHKDKFGWTKDKPIESYTDEDYTRLQKLLAGGDPPGTCMFFTLLRTDSRESVGLLDEAYTNNSEDYDWNRRCFLKGKKILTCTHSLVHHECGVTKQKAAAVGEMDGYDLVARAKNIFNEKWKSEDCDNPDIYGRSGSVKPNKPWCTQIPL